MSERVTSHDYVRVLGGKPEYAALENMAGCSSNNCVRLAENGITRHIIMHMHAQLDRGGLCDCRCIVLHVPPLSCRWTARQEDSPGSTSSCHHRSQSPAESQSASQPCQTDSQRGRQHHNGTRTRTAGAEQSHNIRTDPAVVNRA